MMENNTSRKCLLDAKSQCMNSVSEQGMNGWLHEGGWNQDMTCPDGMRMTGVEIRNHNSQYKLINVRLQCGDVNEK